MSHDRNDDDTVERPLPAIPTDTFWAETGSSRVEVDLAALTHCGLVRENNEDHYLVARFGRSMETLRTSLPADRIPTRAEEIGYGLVVADGMGGAEGGEVASQLAITTLLGLALHTPDWTFGISPEDNARRLERLTERWSRVQEALRERGRSDPALGRMGTTMSVAVSLGPRLLIGH